MEYNLFHQVENFMNIIMVGATYQRANAFNYGDRVKIFHFHETDRLLCDISVDLFNRLVHNNYIIKE